VSPARKRSARQRLLLALDLLTDAAENERTEGAWTRAEPARDAALVWARQPAIQGFGVARQVTKGKRRRTLALKVYVDRKLPDEELGPLKIPRRLRIPGIAGVIPVDVEQVGKMQREFYTQRARPGRPGFGIGAGTRDGSIGPFVRAIANPKRLFVMSNAHVLAEDGTLPAGSDVMQPCRRDGGAIVGKLSTWLRFDFGDGYPNTADVAIAEVTDPAGVDPDVPLIGRPTGLRTDLREDMAVQKTGYASGHTSGIARDLHYRTTLDCLGADGLLHPVGFRELVKCDSFTAPGDSGAAILDESRKVVGLHVCGSISTSVFCRIEEPLATLGVTLA
jgi:hypothetical protein